MAAEAASRGTRAAVMNGLRQPHPRVASCFWSCIIVAAGLCALAARSALGQQSYASGDIELTLQREHVGLGGIVRPGTWTPLRVTLQNHADEPRTVRCRWELTDADGDELISQRVVTLTPRLRQQVWLYAAPPVNVAQYEWRVRVLDAESDTVLADQPVPVGRILEQTQRAVGATSRRTLGLAPYADDWTQHEKAALLWGLSPAGLPDRWHGLALLEALIWTPDGGDPNDAAVTAEVRQAIREWVRRGGHLVVSLDAARSAEWTGSRFADMLPPVRIEPLPQQPPPFWLGPIPDERARIDLSVLEPVGEATVLARDEQRRPLIVTRQYGTGRVTLIGVDLTDPRLIRMNMPSGRVRIWNTIFNWRGPALEPDVIRGEFEQHRMPDPAYRNLTLLDEALIAQHINMMSGEVQAHLWLAMLIFTLYVAATALLLPALRSRGIARHTWVAFVGVVAFFSVIMWGGGLVLQPTASRIAHFSVVDADAASGTVHVHAWLGLFVPSHGDVEVAVDPSTEGVNSNTLAAPGLPTRNAPAGEVGFLDSQRYVIDAAEPYRAELPFRATAKQLELDFAGRWQDQDRFLEERWAMPQGRVTAGADGWPVAELSHNLPRTLKSVIVIFCPGEGPVPQGWTSNEPRVWRLADWPAGKVVALAGEPSRPLPLAVPLGDGGWSGWLPGLIETGQPGQRFRVLDAPQALKPEDIEMFVQMLTFYGALPPPRHQYRDREEMARAARPVGFLRTTGREVDLAHLLPLRRLIILGHLEESPLPAPLSVDGDLVASQGRTIVRWVAPVE